MHRSGILFVLSAPSGAGKTTLCDSMRKTPDFFYSVSCTTRAPRRGEEDAKDYYFLTEAEFRRRIGRGFFLEHARVHGFRYGTPIQAVKDALVRGLDILLDIDVQGARQIRTNTDAAIRTALVDVFLMPPTFAELEQRLRKRATDDEASIRRRLSTAREEMRHWREYDYVILSGSVEEDVQKFRAITRAERYRATRLTLDEFATGG
ncbi:MAG: guanylate kinase [Verrucomicrobia bacterium]|nr:guanylate kinase [Verrucomicrobiota bacterium]